ncbi:MAG: DUF3267 domain-containing protein [Bacteroidales bacterium]|nr:DUF3267 domain-containing protein [Bacteroidales bacterium]
MNEEENRKLSEKEQRRLAVFEENCEKLTQQGYKKTKLTISIVKANLFVFLLAIPVIGLGVLLFVWQNPASLLRPVSQESFLSFILFFASFVVLIVVHELIHGLTWGLLSEHHFKDIEFGLMKEFLTPYCACLVPLSKGHYILGALMPCIILGILPLVIGILIGSGTLLWIGIIMTLAAGCDIMIVAKVLAFKPESTSKEVLIYDHPTQAGSVVFEK